MAGIISVTPQELRDQSRVYVDARNMVDDAKGRVDAMNRQIEQQWRGEAFRSYLEQYNQLAGHITQFKELLESINAQLIKYANTIEERDRQDAKSFGLN
ncbi:MAG: WXG100 family type VII secretion target [Defluviitaleaceae bacterium]|nr:WXG100 family type VII secretion target [Defluviitaleaceae bacterium]